MNLALNSLTTLWHLAGRHPETLSHLTLEVSTSLLMVVYAVLAEESVGRMFLSGVGPGILLSILFALTIGPNVQFFLDRWAPGG